MATGESRDRPTSPDPASPSVDLVRAEPGGSTLVAGQGAPGATVSLKDKIGYIYKFLRNKKESTSTTISVYDDAGTTVDHKSTISDNGTTYTEGEYVSGP